jgi:hypothetical protein
MRIYCHVLTRGFVSFGFAVFTFTLRGAVRSDTDVVVAGWTQAA